MHDAPETPVVGCLLIGLNGMSKLLGATGNLLKRNYETSAPLTSLSLPSSLSSTFFSTFTSSPPPSRYTLVVVRYLRIPYRRPSFIDVQLTLSFPSI